MFSFAWWCASVVGVVFVFAGVQKILAGPDWLVQARKLGAPIWAIPSVRWVELVLGCLLVADVATTAVRLAALALLAAFTALLVARLREGGDFSEQILAQRATDAAVLHLDKLLFGARKPRAAVGHQSAVDVHLAHVVDDDGDAQALAIVEDVVEQRGFAGPEKSGQHGDRKARGRAAGGGFGVRASVASGAGFHE